MHRYLLAALLLFAPAHAHAQTGAAEIVKCTLPNGKVVFTEAPCPEESDSETLDIRSKPSDPEAIKAAAERRKQRLAELDERQEQRNLGAEARAEEEALRKKKCEQARKNESQLARARRIAEGEGENRRYLSDEEFQERKRLNQERIREFCGN